MSEPGVDARPLNAYFSTVLSGSELGSSSIRRAFEKDDDIVLELTDEFIHPDDEVIGDEDMAELFRRENTPIKPKADRRQRTRRSSIRTENSAARPNIRRVSPNDIPLGHVDLKEREAAGHINDFDPDAPASFVGKTVKGRYRVLEMLATDDSGYAYLAEDRIVGDKRVVVRILTPFEGDEVTAAILAEERVRLSHLNHPNVARVFDSGAYSNGIKYLISEDLDALSADEILSIHGRFDPARAGKLIRQIGQALGDVHKQGILHRDLRPANIEIASADGEAALKITNFGVSSGELHEDNIRYAAPEIIEGGVSTVSSDIYSLGVTAYQFLTGDFPFDGATERELVKDQRDGYSQEISPALDEFFAKALSPKPRSRYVTAREAGDVFAAAVSKPLTLPAPAKANEASSALLGASEAIAETSGVAGSETDADDMPAWLRRSPDPLHAPNARWIKIALAVFILLSVIFAAAWFYLLNRPHTPTASNVDTNSNSAYDPTETPPAPRDIQALPNATYFNSNKQNLKGDLYRNFVGFSIYVPKTWRSTGPQEGTEANRGKFLDISKLSADGRLEEQFLLSYYISRGTYSDDAAIFPELVSESNTALSKLLPDFKLLSQGQTTVNGWKAYEIQFQGGGTGPSGDPLTVWGRRIWIPAARPGVRSGFALTLLATSNDQKVKGIADVGVNDDLAKVLATFEPGREF
ncbi:MAG: protein kinase [Acidobacteria bacterium]|nr:protein kinase [Acidobacteriota bacterium]